MTDYTEHIQFLLSMYSTEYPYAFFIRGHYFGTPNKHLGNPDQKGVFQTALATVGDKLNVWAYRKEDERDMTYKQCLAMNSVYTNCEITLGLPPECFVQMKSKVDHMAIVRDLIKGGGY